MRSLFMASAVLASTLIASVTAQADFFGEAYLRAYNAQIQVRNSVSDQWRKAEVGTDIELADTRTQSRATATLNGVTDDNAISSTDDPAPTNPADVERAFVGSGSEPVDNFGFSNLGSSLSDDAYSYADTTGDVNGQLVDFVVPNSNPDSDVSVMVSSVLNENFQTSGGSSQVFSDARVRFQSVDDSEYRLVFDYDVNLDLTLSTPPDFGTGSVRAGFTVTGNPGTGVATTADGRVFALNFGGNFDNLENERFESDEISVLSGFVGSFDFSRTVFLDMQAVPEPGTLAVFGLSALGVCFVGYRRRRNA